MVTAVIQVNNNNVLPFDTVGRPKKKRLPAPMPVTTPPDVAPVIPTTAAAPTPAPPPSSPPTVTTKSDTQATPPSPPDNKDTENIATTTATSSLKDSLEDTKTMDNNIDTVTSVTDDKEELTNHSDTAAMVEPVPTVEPEVVENVKKEIMEEKIVPPSPPAPVRPATPPPPQSPEQKSLPSPQPVEPSSPPREITPPPVVTTPIKEEPREDTVTTPQGNCTKKRKGTPDGKRKSKISLQERRREQASDWIVDFCKLLCLVVND